MFFSETIDNILSIGTPLFDSGVNNWALSKRQALEIIKKFKELKISILGGDVYQNVGGRIQSNYDNWYCERSKHETTAQYVDRSLNETELYINKYKAESDNIYFVFVPA